MLGVGVGVRVLVGVLVGVGVFVGVSVGVGVFVGVSVGVGDGAGSGQLGCVVLYGCDAGSSTCHLLARYASTRSTVFESVSLKNNASQN